MKKETTGKQIRSRFPQTLFLIVGLSAGYYVWTVHYGGLPIVMHGRIVPGKKRDVHKAIRATFGICTAGGAYFEPSFYCFVEDIAPALDASSARH